MLSVEESSLVKSKPIPSLDSTHEPSPEPRTPKEKLIHPSEFPIKFEDYSDTSKLLRHEKLTHPLEEVSSKIPPKEWLMEVKRSSKANQILSSSMTMLCSLRVTTKEALHNPTVETNIMSEFLVETLLSNMPLVSTNKLFKSPLGLFLKCCGIARAVPVIIDKIEVFIDYHIYAILEFDILIG